MFAYLSVCFLFVSVWLYSIHWLMDEWWREMDFTSICRLLWVIRHWSSECTKDNTLGCWCQSIALWQLLMFVTYDDCNSAIFCRALECGRCLADSVLATSWRGCVRIRRRHEYFLIAWLYMWLSILLIFQCALFFFRFLMVVTFSLDMVWYDRTSDLD